MNHRTIIFISSRTVVRGIHPISTSSIFCFSDLLRFSFIIYLQFQLVLNLVFYWVFGSTYQEYLQPTFQKYFGCKYYSSPLSLYRSNVFQVSFSLQTYPQILFTKSCCASLCLGKEPGHYTSFTGRTGVFPVILRPRFLLI